jgi:DNA-binding MarR family transcriptional regulator
MADTPAQTTEPTRPPAELLDAPGYVVRRLYQAYFAAWVRNVDSVLTGPQFAVLTSVEATPGVDQRSLASSAALDASTMTDVSRRLEARGLIVRKPSETDGRRKLLHLTEEGQRVLDEARRRARALDERLLSGRTAEERRSLLAELTALAEHWEALPEA